MEIEILLKKMGKVYFEAAEVVHSNVPLVAALARSLEPLGVRLSQELWESLWKLPGVEIVRIGGEIARVIRERDGEPVVLEWGSRADLERIVRELAGSTGLTPEDAKYLRWLTCNGWVVPLESIKHRQIAAIVAAGLIERISGLRGLDALGGLGDEIEIARLVDTPTDVLRIMDARSGGDASLSTPPRFGRFPKWERRLYLQLLDAMGEKTDDLRLRPEMWKRVGEVLHPGKYAHRYQQAYALFSMVRNDELPVSWTGGFEDRLRERQFDAVITLLKQRPGVFARSLDRLLRSVPEILQHGVVEEFLVAAEEVPTSILLTLRTRFTYRDKLAFLSKGSAEPLPPLDRTICQALVEGISAVLIERFADLPVLGPVYLDPMLVGHPIPRTGRTRAITPTLYDLFSLHVLARGFSASIDDARLVVLSEPGEAGEARVLTPYDVDTILSEFYV